MVAPKTTMLGGIGGGGDDDNGLWKERERESGEREEKGGHGSRAGMDQGIVIGLCKVRLEDSSLGFFGWSAHRRAYDNTSIAKAKRSAPSSGNLFGRGGEYGESPQMADRLTRIAIVSEDKCKPKKCRQECKKSCPVVKTGNSPLSPHSRV
ncbi:hypothetical protein CFC21_052231 [Triticum aestivum]|uniref:RNase L inhibitor RLI-like possible metal-binding domain-containing protein n=2 Tax=Triticum aestivum TaxID=4565 RepID=A0A9R1G9T9_WHEAT|nr:hypothetical protein CFC21_052231 [Triticum aestivum]